MRSKGYWKPDVEDWIGRRKSQCRDELEVWPHQWCSILCYFCFFLKSLMVGISELTNWISKWWAHPLASAPPPIGQGKPYECSFALLNVHGFLRTSYTGGPKPKPNQKQKNQSEVEGYLTQASVKCHQVAPMRSWVKPSIEQASTAVLE